MNIELSIIIVNYNVKYFLEQALRAVYAAKQPFEIEVFVVDNCSQDGSVDLIKEKFPKVSLIANKENVGFSKANNQAIQQAKGTYVLLLNPDTVVDETTFAQTVAFMNRHPNAGALGIKMIDGSGTYLPESKRGFPSPFVAFCKTFGLSTLFPKSKWFNHYHMGYLDKNQNHEIEVLAGAFMLLRGSVIEEVGDLDEAFFMYGEDIDLSYRIIKAGYKNYYFAEHQIIHYKGESTKRGSLNYVRIFYQAMIIFARKHFSGSQARIFVWMLQIAIYFRAGLTVLRQVGHRFFLPIIDAIVIGVGLYFSKQFWAIYHFHNPHYYDHTFEFVNLPLYTGIWLLSNFIIGAYDFPYLLKRLIVGIFVGTILIAAVYGFLDMDYRTSRAIIIMGMFWNLLLLPTIHYLLQVVGLGPFFTTHLNPQRLLIVGSTEETERAKKLLQTAHVSKEYIGRITPYSDGSDPSLGDISHLVPITKAFKIEEIIFCTKDIRIKQVMDWMGVLGSRISYKMLPVDSHSIIGSSSKRTQGELYTVDTNYRINQPVQKRHKRIFDIVFCLALLLMFPISLLVMPSPRTFWENWFQVFIGYKSWVGVGAPMYHKLKNTIKPGILTPMDEFSFTIDQEGTIQRLEYLYAKDYRVFFDLDICLKGYFKLGRNSSMP